jgi:hypothetical protein
VKKTLHGSRVAIWIPTGCKSYCNSGFDPFKWLASGLLRMSGPLHLECGRECLFRQPVTWLFHGAVFTDTSAGSGHGLPFIYPLWITTLVIPYFLGRWWAGPKQRRKGWCLRTYRKRHCREFDLIGQTQSS